MLRSILKAIEASVFPSLSLSPHSNSSTPKNHFLPTVATSNSTTTETIKTSQYRLETLIEPIFPHNNPTSSSSSSSTPLSSPPSRRPISPTPSSNARSVISSLVNTVVESTTSRNVVVVVGGGGAVLQDVQVVGKDELWLVTTTTKDHHHISSSQVKIYGTKLAENEEEEEEEEVDLMDLSPSPPPPPSTPSKRKRRNQAPPPPLELLREFKVTNLSSKRFIEKFEILNLLDNKALILSEGILTFHNLKPSLSPLNVHQFPAIRGVITYSLDAQEQQQRVRSSGSGNSQQLVVVKNKSIHWFRISQERGLESLKDLPLPPANEIGGGLVQVCRLSRGKVCIADKENYSLVDLEQAEAFPLLPISQAPHPDSLPPSSNGDDDDEEEEEADSFVGQDPRQPPSIVCVGDSKQDFLISSHTGTTSLGVFINSFGEPCRGTIEWSESNLISLAVISNQEEGEGGGGGGEVGEFGIGLMWNGTVEIHDLINQELKQRIQLDKSLGIKSLKGIVDTGNGNGFEFESGGRGGGSRDRLRRVKVPLLPSSNSIPSTPIRKSTTTSRGIEERGGGGGGLTKSRSKVLLIGKNSISALVTPNWFVLQEELLEQGKTEECEKNLEDFDQKNRIGQGEFSVESSYLHLKLGFSKLIQELDFENSFKHFLASQCDPRIVIKLFINTTAAEEEGGLNSTIKELIKDDQVESFKGLQEIVSSQKNLYDYILDDLNHNYSPHLEPSVETSPSTVSLRSKLISKAFSSLTSYLMKWRIQRREQHPPPGSKITGRRTQDSRKIDMVVDTSLVCLLAKEGRPMDIKVLLASSNDCVWNESIEQELLEQGQRDVDGDSGGGLVGLVSDLNLSKGKFEKVLKIWIKVVDGEYRDRDFEKNGGIKQVFDLLWKLKDQGLVETYGLWLLENDRELGLRLFNDPKQSLSFNTRELFNKMKEVDPEAADSFLENSVLQEKDTDSSLHVDLVKRYLGKLTDLTGSDSNAKAHLREQETLFAQNSTTSSSSSTFLSFLIDQHSASSQFSSLDQLRLKLILLLSTSSKYDLNDTKTRLEEMEIKNGLKGGLTFERVIIYGKLKLDRQALSLLLNNLKDFSSAETYASQGGDPIVLSSHLKEIASKLNLPPIKRFGHHKKPHVAGKREEETERRKNLAKILVEMSFGTGGKPISEVDEPNRSAAASKRISKILETQAINLDTIEVLPLIPDSFPLDLLEPFLSRSIRRSLHLQQESSILKNLASGQNLVVSEKLFTVQEKFGPTLGRPKQGGGGGMGEGLNEKEKEKNVIQLEKGVEGENQDSTGEKEITVLNQPLASMTLEDAVELDLR
ncbi:hypothetical protein JCM5350_007058 [Sporobolomyces pararoseus]